MDRFYRQSDLASKSEFGLGVQPDGVLSPRRCEGIDPGPDNHAGPPYEVAEMDGNLQVLLCVACAFALAVLGSVLGIMIQPYAGAEFERPAPTPLERPRPIYRVSTRIRRRPVGSIPADPWPVARRATRSGSLLSLAALAIRAR